MYTWIKLIWAASAVLLVLLVLLHSPKGDGLGGIGGQAQLFTSTKTAEKTLNQITWTLTVVFLGLTVALSAGWIAQPGADTTSSIPIIQIPGTTTAPSELRIPDEVEPILEIPNSKPKAAAPAIAPKAAKSKPS
ncbi:preprotein translocase, SecG subunit [Thalassoporum mexicanum PCC 7367]|nr:preprotein translocase subunit SecG [Pseudanabaena sp. PCC 7367]AFY68699.1 preprotein translocase, SecG subunit [Pseudanabaena sp. PCC 7367]